ncbi:DUF6263 family protein [Formosa maritima]|uniref:DUF4412 domain-containing protein n=1 Tax=Formosa maritima TaxID=2592046 RepID=A0A5D0GAG3_9FLAO|nr:DUF6263 family protein [Formosa maritima]TYA55968.1 hypothetical protein FVF61_06700 [Formosa maritima]
MNQLVLKITVFFLLVSSFISSQNTLEYKLNIGDNMIVTQTSTQDVVQDLNGSKHEITNNLESNYTFIIKSITDSSYVINFKFDRFKLLTTSNIYGELMNIDTNKSIEKDDLEAKIFSGLTKSTLKMEMLKTGKILKVSGSEAMINKMVTDAGIEDEFTKELMIEAMKKEFGNESLARSFEQMTYIYPSKKVSIGDTWTNNYSGALKAKNIWTLTNWGNQIELSAKSNVTMITEEDSHIMTLKGTQNTSVFANKKSGIAELITVTSKANGTTVMKQMNGTEIPTNIKSKTTYKIKKHVQ